MAWSIFSTGTAAAASWAQQFLQAAGLPVTAPNEQFVYDWEKSEGGGGLNNPLNQGDVSGSPQLTSTGSQYGGGAADYVSPAAGIQGAVDYINYANYAGVKQALEDSNYSAAEEALWASPWASSHYGYGSAWSTAAYPGAPATSAPSNQAAATGVTSANPDGTVSNVGQAASSGVGTTASTATLTTWSWSDALSPIEGIIEKLGGLAGGEAGNIATSGPIGFYNSITALVADLLSAGTWVRFGEIVLGGFLMVAGGLAFVLVLAGKSGARDVGIGVIGLANPIEGVAVAIGGFLSRSKAAAPVQAPTAPQTPPARRTGVQAPKAPRAPQVRASRPRTAGVDQFGRDVTRSARPTPRPAPAKPRRTYTQPPDLDDLNYAQHQDRQRRERAERRRTTEERQMAHAQRRGAAATARSRRGPGVDVDDWEG
jgi:hypothetical protein